MTFELQRVVWSEGMLMHPQHFQTQERYLEQLGHVRTAMLTPYYWGVCSRAIDEEELKRGVFALSNLHAVLRSGLPLLLDGSRLPPGRSFHELFDGSRSRVEVFIGVPLETSQGPNVDTSEPGSPTRYRSHETTVVDNVDGQRKATIITAAPNTRILFDGDDRNGHEVLKIAEILKSNGEQYQLNPAFIPPALQLAVAPNLVKRIKMVLTRLSARHHEAKRTHASRRHQETSVADEAERITTMAFTAMHIPLLRQLVENTQTPPHHAYTLLTQLTGALTAFNTTHEATPPCYQHDNLTATFQELLDQLDTLTTAQTQTHSPPIKLKQRPDGMFIGRINAQQALRGRDFILAVETLESAGEVLSSVPKLAKVTSWNKIAGLVRSATPGVALTALRHPPASIPCPDTSFHFRLNDGEHLHSITREHNIALFIPPPLGPKISAAELHIIEPEQHHPTTSPT